MDNCLTQLGLSEGVNHSDFFKGKKIIVSSFDDEESDFDEMSIGISKQSFTKENFDSELIPLTNFINHFFECNPNLEYAFCSYELNGYLIGNIKKMRDLEDEVFLKRFPIIYRRINSIKPPVLRKNLKAQDIFE